MPNNWNYNGRNCGSFKTFGILNLRVYVKIQVDLNFKGQS